MKLFYASLALILLTGCMQEPEPVAPTVTVMKRNLSNDSLAHQVNIAISEHPDVNRQTSIRVIAQGHNIVLFK